MANPERPSIQMYVSDIAAQAKDVVTVEFKQVDGRALPPFTAGAHIDIHLPNGLIRNYSLTNGPEDTDRYTVAVGRARDSRGGSAYVHGTLRKGDALTVRAPLNTFPLDGAARAHRFVAGGIGVTPIMAMIRWCEANRQPWRLVYAVRNRQRAAFYEELAQFGPERVQFHFDDESAGLLDVPAVLGHLAEGEHVYCCGPAPMMSALKEAAQALPDPSVVHFEWFKAPEDAKTGGDGFTIRLARDGRTLDVPANLSIMDVLEQNGIDVPFSCREGMCGTCVTKVLEGTPDHRDYVLTTEEQEAGGSMAICVSRAKSPLLVLDL